jgi:hypothetical protein
MFALFELIRTSRGRLKPWLRQLSRQRSARSPLLRRQRRRPLRRPSRKRQRSGPPNSIRVPEPGLGIQASNAMQMAIWRSMRLFQSEMAGSRRSRSSIPVHARRCGDRGSGDRPSSRPAQASISQPVRKTAPATDIGRSRTALPSFPDLTIHMPLDERPVIMPT